MNEEPTFSILGKLWRIESMNSKKMVLYCADNELVELRRNLGWNQCRMAKELDISQTYLCKFETGARELTPALREKVDLLKAQ